MLIGVPQYSQQEQEQGGSWVASGPPILAVLFLNMSLKQQKQSDLQTGYHMTS